MRKPSPISISSPRETITSRPSASAARASSIAAALLFTTRGSSLPRASSSTDGRSRSSIGERLLRVGLLGLVRRVRAPPLVALEHVPEYMLRRVGERQQLEVVGRDETIRQLDAVNPIE